MNKGLNAIHCKVNQSSSAERQKVNKVTKRQQTLLSKMDRVGGPMSNASAWIMHTVEAP